MAGVMRNGGARGLSWKTKEIEELLNLWGEERVQEARQNHHRNVHIFESIAKVMFERGYTA